MLKTLQNRFKKFSTQFCKKIDYRSDMRVLSTTSLRRIVRRRDRASCECSIASTQVNESVDCRTLTGRQQVIETRTAC